MSDIGEYLRLTAQELERAGQDPTWAWNHIEDVREGEEFTEPPPTEARYHHTYVERSLYDLLLRRAGFPVDVSHGEERLSYEDPSERGYGYLTAERVRVAADALADLPYDRLAASADLDEMTRAGLCAPGHDAAATLAGARHLYEGLVEFFTAAARAQDAVLVWQE
ncbi:MULTISPECIES: DUF1877 family protein [unclassified Streptomyces]|uniref:DUF1877 family protein n=1 Tax=unclassified Streptomyces TaxID=2593676 RepID=UPI002E2E5783|nr:DUF1877 family protein [Streptomyces sp. NBC_00273]